MTGRNSKTRTILLIVNIIFLLGLAGTTVYLYLDNQDLKEQLALPEQDRKDQQNQKLLAEIAKIFDLPEEEPTIVYVNDADKAVEENPGLAEVFDDLQKDDYILIFRKSRLAVHYRPTEKKIIKSTEVNLPIAVEIIGSEEAIAAADAKLEDFGNQVVITRTTKDGVTQGFIYDVDGDQEAETKSLADRLGLEIGTTLPAGIDVDGQTEIVIVVTNTKTPDSAATEDTTQ